MPMSPRLLRPRASGATHPEALDWATRVTANGGTFSSTTLAAVSTFCASIQAAGIRDRFYRLNLFCGNSDASLNAVRTPLYLASSFGGAVLGDSTDTNVNFVQGDYAETGASGGLKGNGTSKHLLTGLLASSLSQVDCHLSAYGEEFNSGSLFGFLLGVRASGGTNNRIELFTRNSSVLTNQFFADSAGSVVVSGSPAINAGHALGTSTAVNDIRFVANGSQSGIHTGNRTTLAMGDNGVVVFGINQASGTPGFRVASRLSAYSIGVGMTNSQAASFYTALHAFQTTLGRNK